MTPASEAYVLKVFIATARSEGGGLYGDQFIRTVADTVEAQTARLAEAERLLDRWRTAPDTALARATRDFLLAADSAKADPATPADSGLCALCGHPNMYHGNFGCIASDCKPRCMAKALDPATPRPDWWPPGAKGCPECSGLSVEALQDCTTCDGVGYVTVDTATPAEARK